MRPMWPSTLFSSSRSRFVCILKVGWFITSSRLFSNFSTSVLRLIWSVIVFLKLSRYIANRSSYSYIFVLIRVASVCSVAAISNRSKIYQKSLSIRFYLLSITSIFSPMAITISILRIASASETFDDLNCFNSSITNCDWSDYFILIFVIKL